MKKLTLLLRLQRISRKKQMNEVNLFHESNKIAKDILLDEPKKNNESCTRNSFFRRGVKRALPLSPVPLSKGTRTHTL